MKYLKMKCRHVFIETMMEPILEILNNGPIDLLVGRFKETQQKIRAVIVVAGISVDNEEAFKCQALSFGSRCHSNCRICSMPTKEFYTCSIFSNIHQDPSMVTKSSIEKIDSYNNQNMELYTTRDSISNLQTSSQMEIPT